MFQLMNLIQAGTSFSEIIYTLGRYYGKVYPFSADFNIVLGNYMMLFPYRIWSDDSLQPDGEVHA